MATTPDRFAAALRQAIARKTVTRAEAAEMQAMRDALMRQTITRADAIERAPRIPASMKGKLL